MGLQYNKAMKSDALQIWMLIAFTIVLLISLYKIYSLFNRPLNEADPETEHKELRDIIICFIQNNTIASPSNSSLFEQIHSDENFDNDTYRNFNLNRFNQLIQQLFYTYHVNSLPELIDSIKAESSHNTDQVEVKRDLD